jgi:excisionase family DNA binding protein
MVKRWIKMPSLRELERWLGTGQVSKKLGYSRQGVINLARDGRIRAVKTGAGWLYDPESVEAFCARLEGKRKKEHAARIVTDDHAGAFLQ